MLPNPRLSGKVMVAFPFERAALYSVPSISATNTPVAFEGMVSEISMLSEYTISLGMSKLGFTVNDSSTVLDGYLSFPLTVITAVCSPKSRMPRLNSATPSSSTDAVYVFPPSTIVTVPSSNGRETSIVTFSP